MLPTLPRLPEPAQVAAEEDAAPLPLREGITDFRPRSRGWRTLR
ncbi:MAG TPA: hypothetical protein VGR28_02540 [Candidatus Thermoplasmatota archaeon]|jgi:hypothetical protein|nr:hypothetical protein [Candidatus Thermoplasmatota archaeon]